MPILTRKSDRTVNKKCDVKWRFEAVLFYHIANCNTKSQYLHFGGCGQFLSNTVVYDIRYFLVPQKSRVVLYSILWKLPTQVSDFTPWSRVLVQTPTVSWL